MKNITEFINESIKARFISNKSDFTKEETKFINKYIGTKWYIISNNEDGYEKIESLIKDMKPTDRLFANMEYEYKAYVDDSKGIKVIHMENIIDEQTESFIINKATKDI